MQLFFITICGLFYKIKLKQFNVLLYYVTVFLLIDFTIH